MLARARARRPASPWLRLASIAVRVGSDLESEGGQTVSPFKSILCGIEGNPSSTEAARQAIALAGSDAVVDFLAVSTTFRLAPEFSKEQLDLGLKEATALALAAGVSSTAEMRTARYAIDVLLPEAERHDLLVIGSHGSSRAAGIVSGSTASEAAHETGGPLLIAREPPDSVFLKEILFASDGSPGSWAPAHAAAEISAAFDSNLEIIRCLEGADLEGQRLIEDQIVEIATVSGREAQLTETSGHPTEVIVEAAREKRSSLIICGRRGLRGIKALGSVSERVVHRAECSVLLIPPGQDPSAA